jgi:phosphatidylglycerol---prolipoprotein diacylglyceryl transferase
MDRFDEHSRWLIAAPIYAVAYAVAALIFWRMARRRGLAGDDATRIMAAGLIGGLAGANLLQLLATGLPGKAIEGGIAGGWLAVIWMKRRLCVTSPTGDLFALAIPAGEAIGRIGCFVGGCCFGKAATVAWAVHDHGLSRHPTQLYSSLAAALCLAILYSVERRAALPPNGLFFLGGIFFCLERFAVDFYRAVPATAVGLTLAQCACVAGALLFAVKLWRLLQAPFAVGSPLPRAVT